MITVLAQLFRTGKRLLPVRSDLGVFRRELHYSLYPEMELNIPEDVDYGVNKLQEEIVHSAVLAAPPSLSSYHIPLSLETQNNTQKNRQEGLDSITLMVKTATTKPRGNLMLR